MAKREFLMLAHNYDPKKHGIAGWYMSEKLDGMRAFWDGGVSLGMPKYLVPWANCAKDSRYKEKQYATGLWSRYGNVIHAPDWWLEALPNTPLDGELYMGASYRQDLMSIVKKQEGDGWDDVKLHCFDIPYPEAIFADGEIKTTNLKKQIVYVECRQIFDSINLPITTNAGISFRAAKNVLQTLLEGYDAAVPHPQQELPFSTPDAERIVAEELVKVTDAGGEGLMLRSPGSVWKPERSHQLVKVKKLDDAEGTVIGYTTGRETDLGSKLLGLMGALILRLDNGERLELSGFTDAERVLKSWDAETYGYTSEVDWAVQHPGQECPEWISAIAFPRGSTVTFRYRGLTKDGIPQEARYWRKRDE